MKKRESKRGRSTAENGSGRCVGIHWTEIQNGGRLQSSNVRRQTESHLQLVAGGTATTIKTKSQLIVRFHSRAPARHIVHCSPAPDVLSVDSAFR